jgi:hypothetical protein
MTLISIRICDIFEVLLLNFTSRDALTAVTLTLLDFGCEFSEEFIANIFLNTFHWLKLAEIGVFGWGGNDQMVKTILVE